MSLDNGADAILLLPDDQKVKRPLISMVHGGPFSSFPFHQFSPFRHHYLQNGYNLLIINFRGSRGYGKQVMESILGNIGDQDVFDASELTLKACKEFPDQIDAEKVGITGGSFGGFLTTWLIGHPKYNYIWKAAVAWNAIVDLNYMSVCADVPDWCFAVAMRKKMEEAQITKEEVTALFERSPISVVQNVNCPTCLLAG